MISPRYRRGFTAAEKTELWDRWQRGESLKAIGRAFGKPSSSIYFQVAPHGGIRPAPRRRSRLALTLPEREEISRGIAAHRSARSMARLLGHSPSTVSREIRRNGGYDRYRAALADEKAWARARRPKRCKLAHSPRLRQTVASKLRLNWSPEQIAGWLKRAHPEDESCRVSHETIYRSLFVRFEEKSSRSSHSMPALFAARLSGAHPSWIVATGAPVAAHHLEPAGLEAVEMAKLPDAAFALRHHRTITAFSGCAGSACQQCGAERGGNHEQDFRHRSLQSAIGAPVSQTPRPPGRCPAMAALFPRPAAPLRDGMLGDDVDREICR